MTDSQFAFALDDSAPERGDERARREEVSLPNPSYFIRLSPPKPTIVFRTYWEFAAKRQRVYFRRLEGISSPISEDPILSRYRFTNAYRASDRVSQYLIKNVIYSGEWDPEDLFFRILLFKFFNKIETWEALESEFGEISWRSYSFDAYDKVLSSMMSRGEKIYSAAYIMASGKSQFGNARKHQNHLRILESMMADQVPLRISQQPDLEAVYRLIRSFPCMGPFVGFQFTIDLNYSPLVQFSENDFVEAGPGAIDGITKCFSDLGDLTPNDVIRYMADVQQTALEDFEIDFPSLWGRPLHLIDCQNIFCEVDKYARVAHPEFSGKSGRSRIKQIYQMSPRRIEQPYYPPEWGLNNSIQQLD